MSSENFELNPDTWEPITEAGQSGIVWSQKLPEMGNIMIQHSDSGVPGDTEADMKDSYFMPRSNTNIVDILAENTQDIFYARLSAPDTVGNIVADVV